MVAISFTKFRQHAKTYFDRVEQGETIRVLRHGKVIAEVTPPTAKRAEKIKKSVPLIIPGVSLSKAILDERKQS